jgi:ankyrin repeat protein
MLLEVRERMDDAGVIGLVDAYEYSVEAGVAVALREPRLINERTSLGETALHLLVLGDSRDAVHSILNLGAEISAVCYFGETALSLAASHGRVEIVRMLLDANATVSVEGQNEPTLHKAVRSGNLEIVKLLLHAGANANEQAEFAEAAIHIATEGGNPDLVELLMSHGANPMLRSTFDGTALDIARATRNEACIALLEIKH